MRRTALDHLDRGLAYGDGLFETMRVLDGRVRLLGYHLDRLSAGCRLLEIDLPSLRRLGEEWRRIAARRGDGVLKVIVTRGSGGRGYRPSGTQRTRRIESWNPLADRQGESGTPVRVRECATTLAIHSRFVGMKTLGRLESVVARMEWRDARIWEGLLCDPDGNVVCGTMSNLFLRTGEMLSTPLLDRCGIAGVMRRWVMEAASRVGATTVERRIGWNDVLRAEEVFLTNAVAGIRSVGHIRRSQAHSRRYERFDCATALRAELDRLS